MVLHFYQPPTQEIGITHSILTSCYLPLLRLLSIKPNIGITINLSGSLLLQLQQLQSTEFFDLVKKLLSDGKIELLNSVIYHPLIPLTPLDIVNRQVLKNQNLLQDIFEIGPPNGFFPPELALDTKSLSQIGGSHVIVDQSSVNIKASIVRFDQKHLIVNNSPISEILRAYPHQLLAQNVVDLVCKNCPEDQLLVTANDAEIYGHHYAERLQVLSDLLDIKDIKFIFISQAISQFGKETISISKIKPSTWQNCDQFSLWDKNELQQQYFQFILSGHKFIKDSSDPNVLDLLDKSFSSCHPYWLSNWPWWHPDLVQTGAGCLIKAVRMSKISDRDKSNMEICYHDFLKKMWQYQWSGLVKQNYQKFDQSSDKYLRV